MSYDYGRIKTAALDPPYTCNLRLNPFIRIGLKPQPWRPKRNAKRSVGAKHPEGSKGREVFREVLVRFYSLSITGADVVVLVVSIISTHSFISFLIFSS